MADKVDIAELDAQDLSDILTEVKGTATKVKNVAAARKELAELLEKKGLVLGTDDEGNFVLNMKAAKTAAAPAKGKTKVKQPEPEETEEETEEEAEEQAEETEEEEEAEEEVEEEKPAPKAKSKTVAAPAKGKAKVKAEPEEEEEEEAAPKAKRAPPPREARYKGPEKITVLKKDKAFKEGTKREAKWALMKKAKTVKGFIDACTENELPSAMGFIQVCVKEELISVG